MFKKIKEAITKFLYVSARVISSWPFLLLWFFIYVSAYQPTFREVIAVLILMVVYSNLFLDYAMRIHSKEMKKIQTKVNKYMEQQIKRHSK
ncbi:hypothetical protein RY280_23370 [Bacillus paralicheniformis]|uniref:hypothetical protein n=1 Tax=Bacillus paralicheniformis TaxID=1648923 RepID=UPI003A894259